MGRRAMKGGEEGNEGLGGGAMNAHTHTHTWPD